MHNLHVDDVSSFDVAGADELTACSEATLHVRGTKMKNKATVIVKVIVIRGLNARVQLHLGSESNNQASRVRKRWHLWDGIIPAVHLPAIVVPFGEPALQVLFQQQH